NRCVSYPDPPDEAIREILAQTGKTHREDELNCGACGYNSCREKAKAVYYGFAELEMCIPYMRAKAESLSDAVINSSPDGVVVVDNSLRVLSVNPAFERMFLCKQANIKMKKLDYLFDTRYIKEAMRTKTLVIKDVTYPSYNLITRQFIFPIEKNGVVVGILRDLTLEQKSKRELEVLRQETLERARAVIEKQMRVAQEIAGLLGETTAETKVLLTRLMEIVSSGEGRKQDASLRGSGDIPAS
ncbi:MAG TPA: PAS domain-containing protein, partial [Clostridia bacterium]|nr:PAS domain-containing protein [Clostridia bacterium]